MTGHEQAALRDIGAITLFVEDLPAARAFYAGVLRLSCVFEDDNSADFDVGNTVINLLDAREAPRLNGPQDRPWGQRTAAFADPGGHVWEVAQHLPR